MTQTRRLAAILAADVAGYSRLMGADEAGTARALREHHAAAGPLIAPRNELGRRAGYRASVTECVAAPAFPPRSARSSPSFSIPPEIRRRLYFQLFRPQVTRLLRPLPPANTLLDSRKSSSRPLSTPTICRPPSLKMAQRGPPDYPLAMSASVSSSTVSKSSSSSSSMVMSSW